MSSVFACGYCRQLLLDARSSYRRECAMIETPLTDLGPLFSDSVAQTGVELRARLYLCPSCGLSYDTEVVAPGDPILDDVVVAPHVIRRRNIRGRRCRTQDVIPVHSGRGTRLWFSPQRHRDLRGGRSCGGTPAAPSR
jgi:hypothetical protein